jgi:hypothetical protein
MKYKSLQFVLFGTLLLTGCTAAVPEQYTEARELPAIHPKYNDITIPYNMAPLNVAYEMDGKEFITELRCGEQSLVMKGKQTDWNIKKWQGFLGAAKGETVMLNAYVLTSDGWIKYHPI